MGYYKGAPHIDCPIKGVHSNLLFLTAENEYTTFLSGPAYLFNDKVALEGYPEEEIFMPGVGAVTHQWTDYLKKQFVICYLLISLSDFPYRYSFMLNFPEVFEEDSGLFRVFPLQKKKSRTSIGDVLTFEAWCNLHCNPLPRKGEARKVIFWYSFEEKELGDKNIDADFQLNPWTLYQLVHPDFEKSLVSFDVFLLLFHLILFFSRLLGSLQHGLSTSLTHTSAMQKSF